MADGLLQDLPRDLPSFLERFGAQRAGAMNDRLRRFFAACAKCRG